PFAGTCVTNTKISLGSYDITTMALSLDVFLRLPLFRSADAPGGRVQPYVLGGAPVFMTSFTPRNTHLFRNADGDSDITFGYLAGDVLREIAREKQRGLRDVTRRRHALER